MQSHPGFSATLVHLDGSAIVVLLGELDMSTVSYLEGVVHPLITNGPDDLVLDPSGLSFIDSTGITVLVRAHKQLHDLGRRLVLRSPRTIVSKALEVTSLTDYLNIVD